MRIPDPTPMDVPEPDHWTAPTAAVAHDSGGVPAEVVEKPPSRGGSIERGAKTGFRLVSYVVGPLAGLIALAGAVPMAIGLGAGRGLAVHTILLNAVGMYVGAAVTGGMIGGGIGLFFRVVAGRDRSLPLANRPIRLRFWKKREAVPPAWRRPRWPWVVGVLSAVVLGVAYWVGFYLGIVVDGRMAAAVATADADDPHWRLHDMIDHRLPVADAENSAPVVAKVVSLLPANWPAYAIGGSARPSLQQTDAALACERVDKGPDNHSLDAATVEVLRRELSENQRAVRLARSVAGYAGGQHEVVLGPTILDTSLTETQRCRTAARLLAADAALRAHDGDFDGALESCRAVIGVGRSIGEEPFSLSQLVRVALGSMALRSTRHVLGQGEPTDAALSQLQALILDEADVPLLVYCMRNERATINEILRRLASGETSYLAYSEQDTKRMNLGGRVAIAPWTRLWFENQQAVGLGWMNHAVAVARSPGNAKQAGWRAWEAEIYRLSGSRVESYFAVSLVPFVPAVAAIAEIQDRHRADLRATALLLAAERHRRKTGQWPQSAEAIDPEILANPPLDPYTGQPFLFERRDGRLTIHSVGPNLRDERGAFEPRRWTSGGPDDVGATAWDVSLRRQPPVEQVESER